MVEVLRAHVVRRADEAARALLRGREHLREPKVSNLQVAVGGDEQVRRLQVAVQNASAVYVLDTQEGLRNPLFDLRIAEVPLGVGASLQQCGEITALAVAQHHADCVSLLDPSLLEVYDVRVP